MRRIDKEYVTLSGSRRNQQWFQRVLQEICLSRCVSLDCFLGRQRDRGSTALLQTQTFFKKFRT